MKILIVEDSRADRALLRLLLESRFQKEAKFREAESLQTAEAYLARGDITCIILDLHLPDSVGKETFFTIARKYPHIPTVVLTNTTDTELGLSMIKNGAADYVVKDYTNEETLFLRILFAIERHKQRLEYEQRLNVDLQGLKDNGEQLIHVVSHDLREPTTTLAGYATLLQKKCGDRLSDEEKVWLQEVINCAKHLEEKIDGLLAFSRAGRDTPQGVFSLGSAIEEAERMLVRKIQRTQAKITVKVSPQLQGDRSLIAQVFQNLFSNAIKYRKKGTPPVIVVNAEPYDKATWLITVKDNGLGFSMQFRDRIFGIFQRLYTVEQYPGTGLGLAITKKIIERHGGSIWPESTPGEGTTFYLTLPAAPKV